MTGGKAQPRSSHCSFTPDGQYFALLSVDGRLRIWETVTGKLLQEFTPSSHLETTCTCLCWFMFLKSKKKKRSKRKKKSETEDQSSQDDTISPSQGSISKIILGAKNGKIFIYNPVLGGLEKAIEKSGHKKTVTDLAINKFSNCIYSSSEDCKIIEWDSSATGIKSEWKADDTCVESITLSPNNDVIISAGRLIKMWSLDTKDLLQTFNGHSSPVSQLLFLPWKMSSSERTTDNRFFLSSSAEDRIINIWHIDRTAPKKAAHGSFLITDSPVCMDLSVNSDDHKSFRLGVACADGAVHLFETDAGSSINKPLSSTKTLQISSGGKPQSFQNIRLSETSTRDSKIDLVSGPNFNPRFDCFMYSKLDPSKVIKHPVQENLLTTGQAGKSTNTVIGKQDPSGLQVTNAFKPKSNMHQLVTDQGNEDSNKLDTGEPTIAELLGKRERKRKWTKDVGDDKSSSSAMSFSTMVSQAMHSNDSHMLTTVLQNQSEQVIEATVKRLSSPCATKLFKFMVDKICSRNEQSFTLLPWMRMIMSCNMGYLSSSSEAYEAVSKLNNFLKRKSEFYPKLHRLEGKISFLVNQANSSQKEMTQEEMRQNAIVYHEESDEDVDLMFNFPGDEMESSAGEWNPSDDVGKQSDEEQEQLASKAKKKKKLKQKRKSEEGASAEGGNSDSEDDIIPEPPPEDLSNLAAAVAQKLKGLNEEDTDEGVETDDEDIQDDTLGSDGEVNVEEEEVSTDEDGSEQVEDDE